jgi:hypothetical protein
LAATHNYRKNIAGIRRLTGGSCHNKSSVRKFLPPLLYAEIPECKRELGRGQREKSEGRG